MEQNTDKNQFKSKLNLSVLQRYDSKVKNILAVAGHVSLYIFQLNSNTWVNFLGMNPFHKNFSIGKMRCGGFIIYCKQVSEKIRKFSSYETGTKYQTID
jgi:hypothetical protein